MAELRFSISPNVFQIEVSERNGVNAQALQKMQRIGHSALVVFVRAWRWQGDRPQRQSRSFALSFEQFAPNAMHCNSVEDLVDRSQKAEDQILFGLLTKRVQSPCAVLTAAPGDHYSLGSFVGEQGKIVPSI